MARCRGFLPFVAVLLLIAPPAAAQSEPQPQAQIFAKLSDAEVTKRVQTVVDRLAKRPEFVGLSVAVGRADHVIVDQGFGMADLEWEQPAGPDSLFRIGSLTKQFTAAAIMKLVERKQLSLDDPLAKFVPDFDTGGRTITIRQLLNHSSGIPNYTAQPGFMGRADRLDLGNAELLQFVKDKPFGFEPGKGWAYSNSNYYLLGMIVETLGGRSYGDFLQQEFFKPLTLAHSRVDSESAVIRHRARGYGFNPDREERRNAALMATSSAGGAGAMLSTAGDLVRWQIALTGGRAVTAESFAQMISATADTGITDMRYGFGLIIDKMNGLRRVSHNGGINGFNSTLSWLPDVGLFTAVISNSEAMPSGIVEDQIIASLTSNDPPPAPRSTPQPGAEQALRKLIADEAAGTPDYAMMSPQMAEATRAQLPQIQKILGGLGVIRAVTFREVGLGGLDIYRVDFEKGALYFNLTLYPDGKIATLFFRAAPAAK